MGGIPPWALALGAPLYIGQVANSVTDVVDSLNSINKAVDDSKKRSALDDVTKLRADYPSMVNYIDTTGTPDMRFWNDPESRDVLSQSGFSGDVTPFAADYPNIYSATEKQALAEKAASEAGRRDFVRGVATPETIAAVSDPSNNHITALERVAKDYQQRQQGGVNPALQSIATVIGVDPSSLAGLTPEQAINLSKEVRALNKETRDTTDKAGYLNSITGIGGMYQDTRPTFAPYDTTAAQKAWETPGSTFDVTQTGSDYVDDKGQPTKPYLMPFDKATNLIGQAAAAYGQDPSKDEERLLRTYENSYNADGSNWLGKSANQTEEQLTARALKGDKEAQAVLDAMQRRKIQIAGQQRQVIVNNPVPPKMRVDHNSLEPEEQAAINRAVKEGRLDPYKINSRNQKTLAGIEMEHPGTNLNDISAKLGVARNKDVITKAGVAEMLPGLLRDTAALGKKLNYSNTQFVGKVQQWGKGQLNDPAFTEYMVMRNDLLLTIGGVMRSNGMTDMAQRLEEQAARPTMSPRALDGWLQGQLKAVEPRLKLYRSLTGGRGIPESPRERTIVERRRTKSGKILVKYSDGTIGEQ